MTKTVLPGPRCGAVTVPASKSQAHRLLICAALSKGKKTISCAGISRDISATAFCLDALCADIRFSGGEITVAPAEKTGEEAELNCGESGSTLRFLLPLVGALGKSAVFKMEGKLPERPIEPLKSELIRRGMIIERDGCLLKCSGTLSPGKFTIPGDVSSQFISGLLFALPLLDGGSEIEITGKTESVDYIAMTENALTQSGVVFTKTDRGYLIPGNQTYDLPEEVTVESDWSSAAVFLTLGALSDKGVTVGKLDTSSPQGDRRILEILKAFGAEIEIKDGLITARRGILRGMEIEASQIPDLVPVISVIAALSEGETRITGAGRLRLKESDRLASVSRMLSDLGADIKETEDGLIINGKPGLEGGETDPWGDHRIAMSAAVAASGCKNSVTVKNARCTEKSYPGFWEDLEGLSL